MRQPVTRWGRMLARGLAASAVVAVVSQFLVFAVGAPTPAAASSITPPDPYWYIQSTVSPGRCLADKGTTNGSPAFVWDCYAGAPPEQLWEVVIWDGLHVVNHFSGKCLTAANYEGGQATVQSCDWGNAAQSWSMPFDGDKFMLKDSYGRCLATKGGAGYAVFAWRCYDWDATQTWW